MDEYRGLLRAQRENRLALPNENFDVGASTGPGQYHLQDKAYADLLQRLAQQRFAGVTPELRANILNFYSDPNAAYASKKDPKAWAQVQSELEELRHTSPTPVEAGSANTGNGASLRQ